MSNELEVPAAAPLDLIRELLHKRSHLRGLIAEFGVYVGTTTRQLAAMGEGRTVLAFDTFTGTPAESFTEGLDVDGPGRFTPPRGIYHLLLTEPGIWPIKGRIEETLDERRWWAKTDIVLAYVDCDLYSTTKFCLNWLARHLVSGGVIVIDDYATHPGIRKAVGEFIEKYRERVKFDAIRVLEWT